jgi:hypothetical protein
MKRTSSKVNGAHCYSLTNRNLPAICGLNRSAQDARSPRIFEFWKMVSEIVGESMKMYHKGQISQESFEPFEKSAHWFAARIQLGLVPIRSRTKVGII